MKFYSMGLRFRLFIVAIFTAFLILLPVRLIAADFKPTFCHNPIVDFDALGFPLLFSFGYWVFVVSLAVIVFIGALFTLVTERKRWPTEPHSFLGWAGLACAFSIALLFGFWGFLVESPSGQALLFQAMFPAFETPDALLLQGLWAKLFRLYPWQADFIFWTTAIFSALLLLLLFATSALITKSVKAAGIATLLFSASSLFLMQSASDSPLPRVSLSLLVALASISLQFHRSHPALLILTFLAVAQAVFLSPPLMLGLIPLIMLAIGVSKKVERPLLQVGVVVFASLFGVLIRAFVFSDITAQFSAMPILPKSFPPLAHILLFLLAAYAAIKTRNGLALGVILVMAASSAFKPNLPLQFSKNAMAYLPSMALFAALASVAFAHRWPITKTQARVGMLVFLGAVLAMGLSERIQTPRPVAEAKREFHNEMKAVLEKKPTLLYRAPMVKSQNAPFPGYLFPPMGNVCLRPLKALAPDPDVEGGKYIYFDEICRAKSETDKEGCLLYRQLFDIVEERFFIPTTLSPSGSGEGVISFGKVIRKAE